MTLPDSLTDPHAWQRPGARLGRLNQPIQPDGEAPTRAALRAVLAASHRQAREGYLQEIEKVDSQRGALIRRIHELHAQSQTDPRQASALPTMLERKQAVDAARRQLHERFIGSINAITCQAELCDVAWRAGNERARDRRIVLEPTSFVLAADLLAEVPDPFN